MRKWPKWVPIVLGIAILLLFVGVGAVVLSVVWLRQNLQIEHVEQADSDKAFEEVRQRFAGKAPLITFKNGIPQTDTAALEKLEKQPRVKLNSMHVLAWDPDDEEMARISIPFWLLMMKSTPIEFGSYASGADALGIKLRAEDIERYGPGIIVDTSLPRGARFLMWVD